MSRGFGGLCAAELDEAVEHASGSLKALDGASLFITGGTGFFGRWLLAVLAQARERLGLRVEVTVLSRRPDAFAERQRDLAGLAFVRLLAGDVRTFAFPSTRFSHIIHAATDTSVTADRDPAILISSITDGTRRVLELAAQCGAQRLLYVSSGAVYGRQPSDLAEMPEDYSGAPDPLDVRSAYGQAKRLAEQLCTIAAAEGGVAAVIARAFAFVGPGLPLDAHFAIGNFIRDATAARDISVTGDGSPSRSYLYAGDLAAWLLILLVRGRSRRAYNVGSDQAISIADLARLVGSIAPGSGRVAIGRSTNSSDARNRYIPCIDRARAEIGLDVWTPLDEAIRRTIRHLRDHSAGS